MRKTGRDIEKEIRRKSAKKGRETGLRRERKKVEETEDTKKRYKIRR